MPKFSQQCMILGMRPCLAMCEIGSCFNSREKVHEQVWWDLNILF